MNLQGVGTRSLAAVARDPRQSTSEREHCLGLGTECTKASAAASGRRKMSLDIPFYRTFRGHVASHLLHPGGIGVLGDSRNPDTPRVQMDEKQNVVRHHPAPRQHLSREEVGTRQNTHVGTDEVLPRRTLPAFGCGRNTPPPQDVPYGL